MVEKHKISADGVLKDGVSHYPADAHDLQTYRDAQEELSRLQAPVLLHANNPHERLFIAAFDGTGNDGDRNPEHATGVHKIRRQIEVLNDPGIAVDYVAGPGTQSNPFVRLFDGARGHTYDERTEEMYRRFIVQAKEWIDKDPSVQIRVAGIGFSRGGEQAVGFARLLHERGIQDPAGAVYKYDAQSQIRHVTYTEPPLVAPGQVAQTVGLFDPVGTGEPVEEKDRRLPPSVISGFQIIAEDERRGTFKASHIIDPGMSSDGRFLAVTVGGAHSNIGDSYHRDGLGARSTNLMVDWLNASSDRPFLEKRPEPDDPRLNVVHRSEEGMLIYRLGSKVDRLQPEGQNTQLVPDHLRGKVPDAYSAEPRDEALNAQFERQSVRIGAVPDAPGRIARERIDEERAQPSRTGSAPQVSPKTHVDDLFERLCQGARNPDEQVSREQMRGAVQEYRCTPQGQQFQQDVEVFGQQRQAQERQAAMEAQMQQQVQEQQRPRAMSL